MKKIILIIYFIMIVLLSYCYFFIDKKNNNDVSLEKRTIKVDLKGAVNNPGVKNVLYGTTIDELINENGGLLDNADTSTINLSKKLNDEDVVIVYTKEELQNNNPEIRVVEKECICPVITNNSCIKEEFIDILSNTKISLNSATKEELITLPGIGNSKADSIIEYRQNTLFNSIEDIKNVKGIGQALFEKIKDFITI